MLKGNGLASFGVSNMCRAVVSRVMNLGLHSFFWVIPRRLNFMFRRFGTHCPVFIGHLFHATQEDGTECSETSAHEIQRPWNYPKSRKEHAERGESLKSVI